MKKMKLFNVLAVAAATTALVSFQYATNTKHEGDEVHYHIDKAHSVLKWKAGKSENYFHTGTVMFKDGSLEMDHNMVEKGNFEVDLSTIKVTDENLPEDKRGMLAGHLQTEDFFNVAKFATASVKVGEYKDGKLHTTVTVLGVAVSQDIPVTLKADGKTATINGKFDFDFTSAKIPGTIPQEGDTESISPVFSFDLNLTLNAAAHN
jgi:polyisoprenoid-binding protein YceI